MKPEVTIATLNWNGIKYVKTFFDSVASQGFPKEKTEVIMVDNGSTDGSLEFVKKNFPFVKTIELEKNYGFSEACNMAYSASQGKFFLQSGNDTIMPKDLVSNMLSEIKKTSAAAVLAIDYPIGSELSEERFADTINIICGNSVGARKDFNAPAIPRGTFILDKSQIGGELFDGEYFAYGEDTWLGFKLLLAGKKAIYSPKCKIWHDGAKTGSRLPTLTFYTERNRLLNIFTFFKAKTILKIFPIMIIDFFVKLFSFALSLNFQRLKNFFRAYAWMILNVGKVLKKRAALQAERKFGDEKIISVMSYKLYGYQRMKSTHTSFILGIADKFMELYCRLLGLKVYELSKKK